MRGLTFKSQALEDLKAVQGVAKRFGYSIKTIRTDEDLVYKDLLSNDWYLNHGILHEKSIAYTPQQNGQAERAVRTMSETGRTLLQNAIHDCNNKNISAELWPDAVACAAYVHNRTWHRGKSVTPYELLTKKTPDVSSLRVFGSLGWVQLPKILRLQNGKFSPKRKLLTFIGYEDGSKAWKFFDSETNKTMLARDASFLETSRTESYAEEIDVSPVLSESSVQPGPVAVEEVNGTESSESQSVLQPVVGVEALPTENSIPV